MKMTVSSKDKKKDKKLRESEKQYRDIFENLLVGVCILDPESNYIDVNDAWIRIIGYSREELLGMNVKDILYPEDREKSARYFRKLADEGAYRSYEGRVITKGGDVRWIEVDSNAIVEDGEVVGSRDIIHDITERKKVEGALWESEERCRTIVEQSPISMQIMDSEGHVIMVNRAWEKLWGVSLDDLGDYTVLKDKQLKELGLMPYIKRGFSGEYAFIPAAEYDVQKTLGKGRTRWVQAHIYPVTDERGGIRNVVLMHEDITERKQAEDELRKSEERVRLMISEVKDYAILMLDPDGNVTSWNEGAQRIKGYRAEEIIGKHFSRFYTKKDIKSGKPDRALKMAAEKGRFEDEEWRVRKDGSQFMANVVITAIRDQDNRLIGFSKVVQDITERKQAEETLRESEARHRTLVESSTDAIISIDEKGTITLWNEAAENILGYSRDETIDKKLDLIIPEKYREQHREGIKRFLRTEHPKIIGKTIELEAKRKDGKIIPIGLSLSAFKEEGKYVLTGIIRDVTERKQRVEALLRSSQIQIALNKLLQISLEDISLNAMLEKVIDHLTSISWLTVWNRRAAYSWSRKTLICWY